MTSPFPRSASAPGEGDLVVRLLPHDMSALSTVTYQYPLKLVSPSPSAHQKSVLVFLLTYGGGLVGGDQVNLRINVQVNSKLSIATQGHTKIFKSPSRDIITRQKLNVRVDSGAAMCLLPDPVQPFKESVYEQNQIFNLDDGASLCLLDWVSCGRTARGEDWDFWGWKGKNEIYVRAPEGEKDRLLLRDNVILDGDSTDQQAMLLKKKMHGIGLFGTLVLKGPSLEPLAEFFLLEFAALPRIGARDFRSQEAKDRDVKNVSSRQEDWRAARLQQERADGVLWSVAKVRGCTVVKFGSRAVEGGRHWIGSMLVEEESIAKIFGEDALMCVR